MMLVVLACCALVIATTVLHYEVLGWLNSGLAALAMPPRAKLVVVILVMFVAHAAEIALYGASLYLLVDWGGAGSVVSSTAFTLSHAMYFSAETFTSLGFGDLTPVGPIRMLVGVEALNGLLLIGWSASFTYLSMERFWQQRPGG